MVKNAPVLKQTSSSNSNGGSTSSRSKKQAVRDMYNERNNKPEVPDCDCFANDKKPPEPGSYYTHLGEHFIFKLILILNNFLN